MERYLMMRAELGTTPTVRFVAAELRKADASISRDLAPLIVVGALQSFWASALAHCDEEGLLPGYTLDMGDDLVRIDGFCRLLSEAPEPWLIVEPGGLRMPDFDKWLSQSAVRKIKDAVRKRVKRSEENRAGARASGEENAPPVSRAGESHEIDAPDEVAILEDWTPEHERQVRDFCNRTFRNPAKPVVDNGKLTPARRETLLKIGSLYVSGDLPESAIVDACESVRNASKPIAEPVGYMVAVMREKVGEGKYNRLMSRTFVPPHLYAEPKRNGRSPPSRPQNVRTTADERPS